MDIFTSFRWFFLMGKVVPCLIKLEPNHLRTPSITQRIIYCISWITIFAMGLSILWRAMKTLLDYQRETDNVIGAAMFIDHYGPLVIHLKLFLDTRRAFPVLLEIHRIDEILGRNNLIFSDYSKTKRDFFVTFFTFIGGSFVVNALYFSENIMYMFESFKNVPFLIISFYFLIIVSILWTNLIFYRVLVKILLGKLKQVQRKNSRHVLSEDNKLSVIHSVFKCIKTINKMAGQLVLSFVIFSVVSLTVIVYVTLRYADLFEVQIGNVFSMYVLGSVVFTIFLSWMNVYIVTPATSFEIELKSFQKSLAEEVQRKGKRKSLDKLNYSLRRSPLSACSLCMRETPVWNWAKGSQLIRQHISR